MLILDAEGLQRAGGGNDFSVISARRGALLALQLGTQGACEKGNGCMRCLFGESETAANEV